MASIDASPGRQRFGTDPALYESARPGYPPDLYAWLADSCGLDAQSRCLEIGAGSGHATRPLLALPVASIVAIEPDAALAAHLREIAQADPRLTVVPQRFEDVELPDTSFDFAFAATSFHWLRRMKAYARLMQALAPGGHVAAWWNVYNDPRNPDDFDAAIAHAFDGLEEGQPKSAARPAFALDVKARLGEMRAAGFVDVRHREWRWTEAFSADRLAALYATFSRVGMAPADRREHLLAEVRRVASDAFDGQVDKRIVTSAFVGHKA